MQLNLGIKFFQKPRVDWVATECTANFYSEKTPAKPGEVCRYKKRSGIELATRGQCSPNLNLNPTPFCLRRGAEVQTDKGERLFERSEFELDPGWTEHRRLPVAQRRDADSRVAFSFAYFTFGEAKEK